MKIDLQKVNCCGCAACAAACPFGNIRMRTDAAGFVVPEILPACRECGKCLRVCPEYSVPARKQVDEPICFAAISASREEVLSSSSGGFFPALAGKILDEGGAIAGTAFDNDFSAVVKLIFRRDDLHLLQQAKYVQNTVPVSLYAEIARFLRTGKPLLLTGTPCQIAAFRNYIASEEYPNLLLAEIICHGVPSPAVWKSFLQYVGTETGKILEVFCRDKSRGWHDYGMKIRGEQKTVFFSRRESAYMKLFLHNVTVRDSCFSCPFKAGRSGADLTMGDFWKLRKYAPELDDNSGVSMVIVHSKRGMDAFRRCRLAAAKEFPMEAVKICNSAYFNSAKPHPFRSKYFSIFTHGGRKWFDPTSFFRKFPEKGVLMLLRKLLS